MSHEQFSPKTECCEIGKRIGTLWCDSHSGVVRFCVTVSREWYVSVRRSVRSGTFLCDSKSGVVRFCLTVSQEWYVWV